LWHVISTFELRGAYEVGPVELIRIRLQTQPVEKKIYSGPIDCIRQIYKAGGIRALYRGLGATVAREGHGMGYLQKLVKQHADLRMYFLTYESLVKRDTSKGMKREDIPHWKLCLYGALYYLSPFYAKILDLGKQCG